ECMLAGRPRGIAAYGERGRIGSGCRMSKMLANSWRAQHTDEGQRNSERRCTARQSALRRCGESVIEPVGVLERLRWPPVALQAFGLSADTSVAQLGLALAKLGLARPERP